MVTGDFLDLVLPEVGLSGEDYIDKPVRLTELLLVHRVLESAEQDDGSEEEWRRALDAALIFAERQDSPYVFREKGEFDVSAALSVARATGLVEGFEAEVRPAENGRPEDWSPDSG